jgi:hypothetical protein
MVTLCIRDIKHFNVQLMHTTLKTRSYENTLKIKRLLQHVSVYKETIIREPTASTWLKLHTRFNVDT